MIKNRTVQLMHLTSYCALSIIAFIASFGLFEAKFEVGFYVYFTNISNYICMIIMFIELYDVIKRKGDDYIKTSPSWKFMGIIMILITFILFNFVLSKYRPIEKNLTIASVLMHAVLPVLYILDWILFYERKKTKWYYPLFGLITPFLYVIFIFIRAFIKKGKGYLIYPYFFLNIDYLGVDGVIVWLIILLICFLVVGYILYIIDHYKRKRR